MVARADASGLLVKNVDNTISTVDPSASADSKLLLTYGKDMIAFSADVDARHLYKSVSTTGWDPAAQTIATQTADAQAIGKPGNLSTSDLADVIGLKSFGLQTSATMPEASLTEWAKAQQIKSALSQICGTVSFKGSSKALIGDFISIAGVGDRFNGDLLISGVTHDIRNGGWTTTVKFGVNPAWFAEQQSIEAHSTGGLLPAIHGLMVGKVLTLTGDPDSENRIQVSVPVNAAEEEGVWARLIQGYASSGFGSFFIPEVGDEVILGFLNCDPSSPIILGSVYSSSQAPAYALDDNTDNKIKALVTQSGHTVEFDDDKKIITVKTPGGNTLILDDDKTSITVTDSTGNKIVTDKSGITLKTPKDFNLSATGNVAIKANGKVDITAGTDATIKGLNVNATADVGFAAKGKATAELSASGQTTVKGAMVMIN
jgi:uncharacterized protein involved in type VI secretion and phage assembly